MTALVDEYRGWVGSVMGKDFRPHPWQEQLAVEPECLDRLIRIPTGFGKTLGILLAWGFNRLYRGDDTWPRRLVWCLPMRVLVEQTESEVSGVLTRLKLLWEPGEPRVDKVGVYRLLGGSGASDYHLWPEECSVIIGTQDMLLSRALNRGYAAARARWPMEFGLLNQDALWILDEVQLMDVGLATSAQLQSYRRQDEQKTKDLRRACRSWWMSATLQPDWLRSVDTDAMLNALPPSVEIPPSQQKDGLWAVNKTLEMCPIASEKDFGRELADLTKSRHQPGTLTLVIVNRVELANATFTQLQKLGLDAELRLVHSRFRAHERSGWRDGFLRRSAPLPQSGRIVIATQVVEAGVDISATTLITDLAPWSSLIQRFGRCARYPGEQGSVLVLERAWNEEKDDARALPYTPTELLESKSQLTRLTDVAPRALEAFERSLSSEARARLYPYKPKHLLLRREWIDLFDTTPDLSGADIDIGRFIRSGDDLDLQVFWRQIPETGPLDNWKPSREEICAVPFRKVQEWLCGKETKEKRQPRLKPSMRAWVWDWLEGTWKRETHRSDLLPGRIVLVDAQCGGYSTVNGWEAEHPIVEPVPPETSPSLEDYADDAQDNEALSLASYKTIGTHGWEAGEVVRIIAARLGIVGERLELLVLAAETHDIGKSSAYFQGSIQRADRPERTDLAKAPDNAWPRSHLYRAQDGERRPGFRHELASALALFDVLRRCAPDHPSLLGDYAELLGVDLSLRVAVPAEGEWERRIVALPDRVTFDLLAYLVASHHGKVRLSLHAAPIDQEYQPKLNDYCGLPIRGIREGDTLPALYGKGMAPLIGPSKLTLEPANLGLSSVTGPSWTERTLDLVKQYGPATLAWLEALIRAADIRASRLVTPDPELTPPAMPERTGLKPQLENAE